MPGQADRMQKKTQRCMLFSNYFIPMQMRKRMRDIIVDQGNAKVES